MSLKHLLQRRRPKAGKKKPPPGQPNISYSIKAASKNSRKADPITKVPNFRSGFEREFWERNAPLMKLQYEPYKIKYQVIREGQYLPDFVHVPRMHIEDTIIFETKGHFTSGDRKKIKAVVDSNPGLTVVMVFQRDNWITKAHYKRYSDWCITNGIPYVIGTDLTKINWLKKPRMLDEQRVKEHKEKRTKSD